MQRITSAADYCADVMGCPRRTLTTEWGREPIAAARQASSPANATTATTTGAVSVAVAARRHRVARHNGQGDRSGRRPVVVPCGPQFREVLALTDIGGRLAETIHLIRLDRGCRPAVRAVGGEVGHQLDDLIGCRGRNEVELELGAHGQNV